VQLVRVGRGPDSRPNHREALARLLRVEVVRTRQAFGEERIDDAELLPSQPLLLVEPLACADELDEFVLERGRSPE
jgi:hypothetical protein